MSNSKYKDLLLAAYEQALEREPTVIAEWEGPAEAPPIEVVLFAATPQAPIAKLATAGMSALPVTDGDDNPVHLELSMSFPSAWVFDDPDQQWPIEELLRWATYAVLEDQMIWAGKTLVSEPVEPFGPEVDFVGWLAVDPFFVPETATPFEVANFEVHLIDLVPLYPEELAYADEHGTDALFLRLHHANAQPLASPHRRNVCAGKPA